MIRGLFFSAFLIGTGVWMHAAYVADLCLRPVNITVQELPGMNLPERKPELEKLESSDDDSFSALRSIWEMMKNERP